jgi:uncharacterized membrane protein YfbV (UPF0208 family)
MVPRKKKRVFTKLTLRLSLWEYREVEELKKETFSKTSAKAIVKAACNYKRLKEIIHEQQNQIDILTNEKNYHT